MSRRVHLSKASASNVGSENADPTVMDEHLKYRRWTLAWVIIGLLLMCYAMITSYPDMLGWAGIMLWNMLFIWPLILISIILATIGTNRAAFRQPWTTRQDRVWNIVSLSLGLLSPLLLLIMFMIE